LTAAERLPKELPLDFARRDANSDGQVAMAEYSASWSDSIAREFNQFDLNQDGFITPKECLKAISSGLEWGRLSSSSGSSTGSRYSSAPAGNSSTGSSLASSSSAPAAPTTSSASSGGIDSRTLIYFQSVLKKSDANGDGVLTKDEWSSMSQDPTAADADADGKITVEEYAKWKTSK
jgi:hypothetical protein